MAFSSTDVPDRIDLLLNGEGYLLDRSADTQSLHEYTPTFVDRQNVTGAYGDNQQEFWMVLSQSDWSGGEQQKYIRVNDSESRRRYWRGSAVDILTDGQAQLQRATISLSTAGSVVASCNYRGIPVYVVSDTLYRVDDITSISSVGSVTSTLSGLGLYGMTSDDTNVFFAYPSGGTNGCIRKWNGSAFSDFSASLGVTSVEFLNNTLYGAGATSGGAPKLYSFSTSGAATTIYTWQAADGGVDTMTFGRLRRFGGSLLFHSKAQAARIFQYETDAPVEIAQMPPAFYATEIAVSEGIVFIGGSYLKRDLSGSSYFHLPSIFYYVDGRLDELWRADTYTSTSTSAGSTTQTANPVPWLNGIVWWDSVRQQLTYYDIRMMSFSGVSANTAVTGVGCFTGEAFFNGPSSGVAGVFADPSNISSTGYVRTSLFDADSSLTKYWKSVKVDADVPSGATFDIAYRLNDLDGSYTTVQSSATAGTEYSLAQSSRAISIQITLNKGSSTAGPVLKRIYVRGAPIQDSFRRETYVIDCSGRDYANRVLLRDGTPHPNTGPDMVTNLRTAASSTSPFTVVDELGSFTGLIEPNTFQVRRNKDREYRVSFTVRQV